MPTDLVVIAETAAADIEKAAARYTADLAKVEGDKYLNPEGKLVKKAKLDTDFNGFVDALREELSPDLEAELSSLDQEEQALRRQASLEPRDLEGWQLAAARAQFVAEDVEALAQNAPFDVVKAFEDAMADGDLVAAWLINRYGEQFLDKRPGGEIAPYRTLRAAYAAAEEARMPKELARVNGRRGQLAELRARLQSNVTPADRADLEKRFGLQRK